MSSESNPPDGNEPSSQWTDPIDWDSRGSAGELTNDFSDGFDPAMDIEGDSDSSSIPEIVGGYRVGRRIGRGGMGEVFLAEHRSMGRTVALKILPSKWLGRAETVERFYEEIRAASRLMHPNIVTAFDAGQADGIHYLAMEYVNGKTLSELVASDGPMSVGDAASAIRQAAFALHHAHSAGIIHRDVKPGNLMRSVDGTIKLLDLGLARMSAHIQTTTNDSQASDSSTGNRPFVGTLSYISPEQLADPAAADARSDQYSLGATLFCLLTGRPPFVGELIDQVYGHRHGEIPDLMKLRQDVDLTLANIVRRMLAKDPQQRYASMDEVARAMAPYDNDRGTPAWVLDFARRDTLDEGSTVSGDSTRRSTLKVMGIDLGMTLAATALYQGNNLSEPGLPGRSPDGPRRLFRMAVAHQPGDSDQVPDQILFGTAAYDLRQRYPERVAHCQMMYLGRPDMLRQLGGRACPPEITMAMCLRRLVGNTLMHRTLLAQSTGAVPVLHRDVASENLKRHSDWPDAVAITVPGCYSQMHRRSIISAAKLAGLPSIRLIDRSLAAVRAALGEVPPIERPDSETPSGESTRSESEAKTNFLYVGLSGQGLDVAVVRHRHGQIELLSTAGHWTVSSMAWSGRLVEQISAQVPDAPSRIRRSPTSRRELVLAAKIQMAGERAMNSLLLMPETVVDLQHGDSEGIRLTRNGWLAACEDLLQSMERTISQACERAKVPLSQIDRCIVFGAIPRLPAIRERVFQGLNEAASLEFFDRGDVASGAASCVASELPGNRRSGSPVRTTTPHSIGFVVADAGRRKILPIIPRGTNLPVRANRQLAGQAKNNQLTLSLVESSGVSDEGWAPLGRHVLEVADGEVAPVRRLGFEIDVNGLLTVHLERPDLGRTVMLPPLPPSAIDPAAWLDWREWIEAHC